MAVRPSEPGEPTHPSLAPIRLDRGFFRRGRSEIYRRNGSLTTGSPGLPVRALRLTRQPFLIGGHRLQRGRAREMNDLIGRGPRLPALAQLTGCTITQSPGFLVHRNRLSYAAIYENVRTVAAFRVPAARLTVNVVDVVIAARKAFLGRFSFAREAKRRRNSRDFVTGFLSALFSVAYSGSTQSTTLQ